MIGKVSNGNNFKHKISVCGYLATSVFSTLKYTKTLADNTILIPWYMVNNSNLRYFDHPPPSLR